MVLLSHVTPRLETKMEKSLIPCPICGSNEFKVKYLPTKSVSDPKALYGAASGLVGTQTIVRCNECQFIYENPRFPEEEILKGYGAAQESGHDSQYEMRVESFHRALKKHSTLIPKPGAKVLDVGTAGGAFLLAAKRYGYDATGLEPCQYLVDAGNSRGYKIQAGVLSTAPFPENYFDMICFWDVLEHVTDPVGELQRARKFLKPDGVLFINYPDIGTLMAKLAGKRFWWLLSVHLVHFDKKSLTNACRKAGFDPFSWRRYWQTLELGYLFQMLKVFVPFAGNLADRLVPGPIKRWHVSYYASQTTCLAKKSS